MAINKSTAKQVFVYAGSTKIDFSICRSSRKSIGINIKPGDMVRVLAPKWVSESQIKELVTKKASWIIKKISEIEKSSNKLVEKNFDDGEAFLLTGEELRLQLVFTASKKPLNTFVEDRRIVVEISDDVPKSEQKEFVKNALVVFYRKIADILVKERVGYYNLIMNTRPEKITIKQQKSRWGSCSSKGNINFNWKLVMAPIDIVDYVVVHELAHLKALDHSKRFWKYVGDVLPDYKDRRNWLKNNQKILDF